MRDVQIYRRITSLQKGKKKKQGKITEEQIVGNQIFCAFPILKKVVMQKNMDNRFSSHIPMHKSIDKLFFHLNVISDILI